MWSSVIPATTGALIWLSVVTLLFTLVAVKPGFAGVNWLAERQRPLLWLLLIALFVRLLPMLLLPVGARYDIESFRLVAEALLSGTDVYTSAAFGRHPYLPMQMYVIGAAWWAALTSKTPFPIWIKVIPVLADVGLTALIFIVYRRQGSVGATAVAFALLYALNPISLLTSAYHGQFDSVTLLLLGLSWATWHFGRQINKSALLLGLSILNKTWPIVFLPIILIRLENNRNRLKYMLITLAVVIIFITAYLLIFNASLVPMLQWALLHTGVANYWGLSAMLDVAGNWLNGLSTIADFYFQQRRIWLLLMGVLLLWWTRKQSALDALLTIILGEFAITVGLGIQWLLWVVPFALLAGERRWLMWYSLTALILLSAQLFGIHLYPWAYTLWPEELGTMLIKMASIPAWITVIIWLITRMKNAKTTDQNISLI